jgi:hypothetical protein
VLSKMFGMPRQAGVKFVVKVNLFIKTEGAARSMQCVTCLVKLQDFIVGASIYINLYSMVASLGDPNYELTAAEMFVEIDHFGVLLKAEKQAEVAPRMAG